MTLVHGAAVSHLPATSPNSFQDRHGQILSQLVESYSEKPRLMGFILELFLIYIFAEAHHCSDNSVMVLFCCRAAITAER